MRDSTYVDPAGPDPEDYDAVEVKRVHPFQALKRYRCPGCDQWIEIGTGHTVVVPKRIPDDRRHWHHSCYEKRATRAPR